jgi:hypothetical protein
VAGAEISQFVEKHCHNLSNYIIIIKGSFVVRKLPSYGRLSGSILTIIIMSTTSSSSSSSWEVQQVGNAGIQA